MENELKLFQQKAKSRNRDICGKVDKLVAAYEQGADGAYRAARRAIEHAQR